MDFRECQLKEHETLKRIMSSTEEWKKFLSCAARFYKYSFQNQMLIYAQNPEATACADPNEWSRVERRVKEGAKPITLYNNNAKHGAQNVYNAYDVSQTMPLTQEDKFELWAADHAQLMQAADRFKQEYSKLFAGYRNVSLEATLLEVIREKVIYTNQKRFTADNLSTAIFAAQYECMKRLGVEPETVMLTSNVVPPRTEELTAFGDCVATSSKHFLRETEKMVKSLAKQQAKEYSTGNKVIDLNRERNEKNGSDRTEIVGKELERPTTGKRSAEAVAVSRMFPTGIGRPSERGRGGRSTGGSNQASSELRRESERGTTRNVRDGAETVFAEVSAGAVPENEGRNHTAAASGGDEYRGNQSGNDYRAPDGRSAGRDRSTENAGSAKVGRDGEQHHELGAGNREERTDLRVTEKPVVREISESVPNKKAKSSLTPFAFSYAQKFVQDEIDLVLQHGGNEDNSKLRIYLQYEKGKSEQEIADFLHKELKGGIGLKTPTNKFTVWFSEDGMRLCQGNTVRYNSAAQILPWAEMTQRIGELLEQGRYMTETELMQAEPYERRTVAENIWYFRQSIDSERADLSWTPHIDELYGGFPESVSKISELLLQPSERKLFINELETFSAIYAQDSSVMRYHQYKPEKVLAQVEELSWPQQSFTDSIIELPEVGTFITQDEIDAVLANGSGIENGKHRIYSFFQDRHTPKEKADFLSNEYGIGGRYPVYAGCSEEHDSKGLCIKKNGCEDVRVTWTAVAKRINFLLTAGRYLSKSKKEKFTEKRPETVPGVESMSKLSNKSEPVLFEKQAERNPGTASAKVDTEQLSFFNASRQETASVGESKGEADNKPEPVPAGENKGNDQQNYVLTPAETEVSGAKAKYRNNLAAIRMLKVIQAENRIATPEEQQVLARYSGWGGAADAFDASKTAWKAEYAELKELLSTEEYAAARSSTLNAHYTSPEIIRAIYAGVEHIGLKPNSILEPACGTGRFFGCLPDSMRNCKLHGVELDRITGQIAQQLYPEADIEIKGFEESSVKNNSFDLAVGNVPFGDYEVADSTFKEKGFLIHDYFFAKALQKVRPGGMVAFITSSGTMDKKNNTVRKYINQRARFLGAVRLPNNAFSAAGASVTSDIIFLQKRESVNEKRDQHAWADPVDGIETGFLDGVSVNRYFAENPQMVLGKMKMVSGPFGMTATCEANGNLSEQLQTAMQQFDLLDTGKTSEESYGVAEQSVDNAEPVQKIPEVNYDELRLFSYAAVSEKIYFKESSGMVSVECTDTVRRRISGMAEIRDITRSLIDAQVNGDPDERIQALQKALNEKYDAFTKKYGLLSSKINKSTFQKDSSYPLLRSLETLDDNDQMKEKAAIFSKRTIAPAVPVTSVDTASEALAVSLREKARVDLPYMAQLLGNQDLQKIADDLQGVIFRDFTAGERDSGDGSVLIDTCPYVTADEYFSGNVRERLEMTRNLLQTIPNEYQMEAKQNIEALKKVQPVPLSAGEIHVRIGTPWIDKEYYQQFLYDLLKTPVYMQAHEWVNNNDRITVLYSSATGEWNVTNKSYDRNNVLATNTYGTSRYGAYALFDTLLNQRMVRVTDTIEDSDGKKKSVLNPKETAAAQEKADMIDEQFQTWIWKDPKRRDVLCNKYNRMFNSTKPREYDGSHLQFVGMNKEIKLRPHQLSAVARMLYSNRNTLLAHVVGAGKTYEMITAIMESKRLGLCKKAMVIVPNHLTEQWGEDFVTLYPGANILVASEKDFTPQNRKTMCSRIATGNYDAVIIGHSQFEKIPLSDDEQKKFITEELTELEVGLEELQTDNAPRFTVKQLEKSKKGLEARLKMLADNPQRDDVLTFGELGVDRLYVDEAHNFKNLYYFTKMSNVAGVSQTDAQKSSDLFMKVRYLDRITGGRGTVFATGTPISNSMVEMYTMQRYLQYDDLKELGMLHFDNWAANFGQKEVAMELRPEGSGYRAKTRFAKFYNLPELMSLWRESADIQTADMLNLETPEAEYVTAETQPSEYQKEFLGDLAERAELVHNGGISSDQDNMLCITNDGRKLALDQRLVDSRLPDNPNSKVNTCVKNIMEVYQETESRSGAQMVFCDLSTPGKAGFNVYDDIKGKLIRNGVPEDEIAFIHDAKTADAKDKLFAKVRSGKVRILLGSTSKMGAGTNAQDKLVALHHLDCPWRPADLQQREGRILRQGNENKKVKIFRYVTKDTFDAYSWSIIENKQKFIGQVMTSKSPARSVDDIDATALSYAEVKACATGDPRIKEKMELDMAVAKLKMLKSSFDKQHYDMEDRVNKYYPKEICKAKETIAGFMEDEKTLTANPEDRENFSMTLVGQTYTKRTEAGKALTLNFAAAKKAYPDSIEIGEYRSFKLYMNNSFNGFEVTLKGEMSQKVSIESYDTDYLGNIIRIKNAAESIPLKIERAKNLLEDYKNQLVNAKAEVEKEFPHTEELKQKSARLSQLTAELSTEEHSTGEKVQNEVRLPDQADTDKHIRKFLKHCSVSDSVISRCVDEKRLYEDKANNAVFVQQDSNGNTVAAKRYSTLAGSSYSGWMKGSNENVGWLVNNDAQTLVVTDTPVNVMRAMSQCEKVTKDANFLAVGRAEEGKPAGDISIQEPKILNVIKENPNIQNLEIESSMQNARELADSIHKSFPEKICRMVTLLPVQQSEQPNPAVRADDVSPSL